MKFFLVLLVLINISYADEKNSNVISLEVAKEYYNSEKYSRAYNILDELVSKDYNNTLYNYYLAKSATKLNKLSVALDAYKRITVKEPNILEVMMEQARLLHLTGNTTASINSFNNLLSKKISKNDRKKIENYLRYVKNY